jgi:uncharacterized membrane protein YfcA
LLFFGYLAMGLVGVTLGLLGAGGSILTVPILVYFFSHSASNATAFSMGIVGASSLVALVSYWKQGKIKFSSAAKFIPASIFGVFVARHYLLPLIPEVVFESPGFVFRKGQLIMVFFAAIMVLAARSMMQKKSSNHSQGLNNPSNGNPLKQILVAATGVGLVTGFVGAGGGFLIIPALVNLLGMPMAEAVGTSLFIIAINTISGFISSLTHQTPPWEQLLGLTGIAMIASFVSSRFSDKVSQAKLKSAFGWFILFVGSSIIIQQLMFGSP